MSTQLDTGERSEFNTLGLKSRLDTSLPLCPRFFQLVKCRQACKQINGIQIYQTKFRFIQMKSNHNVRFLWIV